VTATASEQPTPEAETADSGTGPRAVHRALELLSIVGESGPLALSDLARASGLPASTALRSLRALEHWDYVTRLDDGRYATGPRFARYRFEAEPAAAEDLIDASADILQGLTRDTGESSYLAVPGPGRTCIYLREVQSDQPIRHVGFAGWTGRTVSSEGSAVGAVLDGGSPTHGYLAMDAVLAPDATVVAAPVRDAHGAVIAAVSIVGPSFRMGEEAVGALGPVVRDAARALTARMTGDAGRD